MNSATPCTGYVAGFPKRKFTIKTTTQHIPFQTKPSFPLSFSAGKSPPKNASPISSWKELTEQLDKDRGITGATEGDGGGGYGYGWMG